MPIDLVLVNGNIRTMNTHKPVAQAVAVRNGRIVKVGSDEEIDQLGKPAKLIDLHGRTVVPGIIDTHVHVADFGRCLMWLDLTGSDSISELQRLLHEKAKKTPKDKWIVGRGWNENRFEEKRLPNLTDLDEASPDNPVILYREAAMICAVNSKAVALAKVTEDTPVPAGGAVDKNAKGKLTGIFRDTATSLIWQAVPEPTVDELVDAAALACREIAEAGLTSIHWILISKNEFEIVKKLNAGGKLLVRVNVIVPYEFLNETEGFSSADESMLRVGGVFITSDGYLDSKTAALSQQYSDDPGNRGKMLLTGQELSVSVANTLASGLQPVIHAMGDQAIETALKVIEKTGKTDRVRFRMEQAAVLNKQLIERLKNLKVIVTVQPTVIATEFAVWSAESRLGVERAKLLHPLKSLLQAGVKVAGGSDCPMEPLSPLLGMGEAVNRASFPKQRLTAEEALKMYTLDAAYCSCEEKLKGSIEEGKLADFTVLSEDPLTAEPAKIKEIQVEMTIVNGQVIFKREPDN